MPDRSSEGRANMREGRVLRAAFLAGAVTDAVTLLPMLLLSFARLLWGLRDIPDSYQLAMRRAASLMLGWTLLLVWASRRPLEHFFNGTYTSSEGAFTAGGGVRAFVGDRVTLGLEMRVGWEPHIRINGLVGLQLGR